MEKYIYKVNENEYLVTTYDYIVREERSNFEKLGKEHGYNSFEDWLANVSFWEATPLLEYKGITFYTDGGRYLSSLIFIEPSSDGGSDVQSLLDNIEAEQDLPVNALHALVQNELDWTLDVVDLDWAVETVKEGYIEDGEESLSEEEKEGENILCCSLDNRERFYFKI